MNRQTYAITELIDDVINAAGIDKVGLVKVLGYNNVNKGLRRLESWRETGAGDADFLKRLAAQFAITQPQLKDVLIQTIYQLNEN